MCYYQIKMKWRLKSYLDEHNLTPYSLVRATGVSPTTVYGIAQGKHERISLEVLDKVLWGLERLTGETVEISDVLEREPMPVDDQAALLASGTAGLGEALDDLERELPPGEVEAWLATFEGDAERG
jgi:DNA-binding Xre family transcriptional regulator